MLAFLDEDDLIALYKKWSAFWRCVIAACYGIDEKEAKRLPLMALYDAMCSPEGRPGLGVLPFLESLGSECKQAKGRLAAERPEFVEHFKAEGRKDPEATTYCYILMDKEN